MSHTLPSSGMVALRCFSQAAQSKQRETAAMLWYIPCCRFCYMANSPVDDWRSCSPVHCPLHHHHTTVAMLSYARYSYHCLALVVLYDLPMCVFRAFWSAMWRTWVWYRTKSTEEGKARERHKAHSRLSHM